MDRLAPIPEPPESPDHRLIDRQYVIDFLTHEAPWHHGHGASHGFLGAGMLYYSFAYAIRAQTAVCLGSGGGFVPRMLRQAQRDLRLAGSTTILVDANLPEAGWGSPQWIDESSFFRREFADVEIIMDTTENALRQTFIPRGQRIDYLHIDADHSYEACLADFVGYLPLMAGSFVISIHDTDLPTVAQVLDELRRREDVELIDLPDVGHGVAFIRPRLPAKTKKLYWANPDAGKA